MSFVGQCPSCGERCEVKADGIGRTMRCSCGVDLFASEPAEFTREMISCSSCNCEHEFNRKTAGKTIQCECGEDVLLPTVVLRMPVSLATTTQSDSKRKTPPRIHCPSCDTAYEISKRDLNEPSECECGCVFTVSIDKHRKLAVSVINPAPIKEPESVERPASEVRAKPKPWLGILGTASVIGFLITSIVMFLMRDTAAKRVPKQSSDLTQYLETAPKTRAELAKLYSPAEFALAIKLAGFEEQSDASSDGLGMEASGPGRNQTRGRAEKGDSSSAEPSAVLRLPPLAKRELPEAIEARERIPITSESIQGLTFEKAYEMAFADYRQTRDLKTEADQSRDPEKASEFSARAGRTLSLLQKAHDLGIGSAQRKKEVDNLRYFLTWMYFQTGWLPEAAIVGESLARWGERGEPATKEAALLALAATQEANATHWGIPERLGELDRMDSIADLIAKRWPNHSDLDAIRMAIAQSYDVFGDAKRAAAAYTKIPKASDFYVPANLGAGNALWNEFRTSITPGADLNAGQKTLLIAARKHLLVAVDALQKDAKKPSKDLMNVKLTLGRLDLLLGKPAESLKWLTGKPLPLVGSVVTSKPNGQQLAMPSTFIRSFYEALFAARSQSDDSEGAKAALQQMSKLLGPGAGGDVSSKLLGVAVSYVDELQDQRRITQDHVKTLNGLIAPLHQNKSQLTADNLLWFGEKWGKLGERASSRAIARQCFANAAKEYGNAMQTKDFPKASRSAALLRQVQLLRQAGEIAKAIEATEQILKTTPNVLQLQIEAAAAIQELSFSKADPVLLIDAIDGPKDSPIWGWKRLVTAVHGLRFSSNGTEQHVTQLAQSQVHLAQCQWLLGKSTIDSGEKSKAIAAVSKMLSRLLKTTSKEQQPWFGRLEKLSELVEAS